jgi:hypothetical protein
MPDRSGQFKTRRNPDTGRLESIPEEERAALIAATPPELPEEGRGFVETQRAMMDGEEPPPLPPEPAPTPAAPDGEEEAAEAVGAAVEGAATGASVGSAFGPVGTGVGAAVGAAAGFVTSLQRDKPVGTLSGGAATSRDDSERTLRELLRVQQGIAKAGAPIKDAITTKATGSRM